MPYEYNCNNDGWLNIAYGNGVFVAIDSSYNTSATSTCVISTDNGKTWTQYDMPIGDLYSVAYGNGVFVAVNYSSNTSATSTDNGVTWTQQSMLN